MGQKHGQPVLNHKEKVAAMDKVDARDFLPVPLSYCSCLWPYRRQKPHAPICTPSHDTGASWLTACPVIYIDLSVLTVRMCFEIHNKRVTNMLVSIPSNHNCFLLYFQLYCQALINSLEK